MIIVFAFSFQQR